MILIDCKGILFTLPRHTRLVDWGSFDTMYLMKANPIRNANGTTSHITKMDLLFEQFSHVYESDSVYP